jgi:hypothetical protein
MDQDNIQTLSSEINLATEQKNSNEEEQEEPQFDEEKMFEMLEKIILSNAPPGTKSITALENLYVLDENKNVVPARSKFEYNCFLSFGNRRVDLSIIGKFRVSTAFIGLDSRWAKDPSTVGNLPVVFETMIFIGDDECYMRKSCTWAEALEEHEKACNWARDKEAGVEVNGDEDEDEEVVGNDDVKLEM